MRKKVILTGITGQCASYFAEYLLEHTDFVIFGARRRLSVSNDENIRHLYGNDRLKFISVDLTDGPSIQSSIERIKPDYYINCAAQSLVPESWNSPVNTFQTDCIAIIYMLEAIRKVVPKCRFLSVGSTEEFGDVLYSPQDLNHPFRARSPYGAAKVASHQLVKVYRDSYDIYAVHPICGNYESPRRGEEFVTRKITKSIGKIYKAIQANKDFIPLRLGNITAKRDWSHCKDIVDGLWRSLNQEKYNSEFTGKPKDYLFGSGKCYSVQDFLVKVLNASNLPFNVKVERKNELNVNYYLRGTRKHIVIIDPNQFRPADVQLLQVDSSLAREELKWEPKYNLDGIIQEMIERDVLN